jgi:hypothetical protein
LRIDHRIRVDIHGTVKLYTTIGVAVAATCNTIGTVFMSLCRFLGLEVFFSSRISIPEPKIGYRIIGLCTFQTLHSIALAVLRYAFIKALVLKLIRSHAKDLHNSICCKHDRQCPRKPVEDESSPRFSFHTRHLKLRRKML